MACDWQEVLSLAWGSLSMLYDYCKAFAGRMRVQRDAHLFQWWQLLPGRDRIAVTFAPITGESEGI